VAYVIIDRRKNDKKKSATNRARYVRRVREQVKEAVKDIIRDGSIQDNLGSGTKKVRINKKGLSQPEFQHATSGGIRDRVMPGNKEYEAGDRLPKPPGGGGGSGSKGSPDGDGDDDFEFTLSREEFLDLFFEDLELPDLVKKDMVSVENYVMKRAGFSVDGNPSRLNILRSMKQAKSRRIALRSPKKKAIEALEAELELLNESLDKLSLTPSFGSGEVDAERDQILHRIEEIKEEIAILKRKKKAVPFIDDIDLRYNRWEKVPTPTTQAVMFGIMDVSGSMDEWKKEMAKRFFMLMLLFLQHNYEKVDIVWIRHHSMSKEVEEEEFFHSQESGGTVVSPAYEMMNAIIKERYPLNQWNVFGTHISDGDNYTPDCPIARDVLANQILPLSQYFAYVEVKKGASNTPAGTGSDLWPHYLPLTDAHKNFVMSVIGDVTNIYPLFRKLFEKRK
jgi:uncharacterized sporulation protein YeaH/YhbH (DUF444 family)